MEIPFELAKIEEKLAPTPTTDEPSDNIAPVDCTEGESPPTDNTAETKISAEKPKTPASSPVARNAPLGSKSAPPDRTHKQQIVEAIIDLEHKSRKLSGEKIEARRKQLSRRAIGDLEKLLGELSSELINKLAVDSLRTPADGAPKAEQPPAAEKERAPSAAEKEQAVGLLYKFNLLCADMLEHGSIHLRQSYPDYMPTDLEGYSKELSSYEKELKAALSAVVDQHFRIISTYMTPMTMLLAVNLLPMQQVMLRNLKKKPAKPEKT